MSASTRRNLMLILIPLMVMMIGTQRILDPQIREIHKGEKTALAGLSNEFILGPMLGLQQAVAGLLWIRADEFFHEGDYDAILPIVRMVTWLDPHQLDVYITGAWHLSYNFTDSFERSDRRYIPASQKLLEEGDANNTTVYDIAFELGWENADKIKNYDRAEKWFRIATTRKAQDDTGKAVKPAPLFVWHQVAHSLERQGRIDEAVEIWRHVLTLSEAKLKDNPKDFSTRNVRDSERHNLELNLKRKYSRYVHRMDWDVDKEQTRSINPVTGEPIPSNAYIETSGPNAGKPRPASTATPWNCAFDARPTFTAPRVLEIKGNFTVGDGARVNIRLADEDWKEHELEKFDFNIDQSQTIMMDQHSVRGGHWGRKIDMSKDPKMYSFTRDYYYLVFEFNPRGTSPFIQDKFGWSGEGLTDSSKVLWIQPSRNPKAAPIRMLRKVYKLSRAQILGSEPITEKNVVPNTEYAKIQNSPE